MIEMPLSLSPLFTMAGYANSDDDFVGYLFGGFRAEILDFALSQLGIESNLFDVESSFPKFTLTSEQHGLAAKFGVPVVDWSIIAEYQHSLRPAKEQLQIEFG